MQKQAREMQAMLAAERVTGVSRDGKFQIIMNGAQDVIEVNVPLEGLEKASVEHGIKEAFTDAQEKVKKVMMEKLKGMM